MVEHCTGIAEVMGSIPVNPGFFQAFFRFFFIVLITAMKLKTHKKNMSKETALNFVNPTTEIPQTYIMCTWHVFRLTFLLSLELLLSAITMS